MKAIILMADGFEEIEAISPADILRRADFEVSLLSIEDSLEVTGAHDIVLKCDGLLADWPMQNVDVVITPGGAEGANRLRADERVHDILRQQAAAQRYIASICASPIALDASGVLQNKAYTCYPGFEDQIKTGQHRPERLVVDDKLITAIGPGAAIEFSLKIVELLSGQEAMTSLVEAMKIKR